MSRKAPPVTQADRVLLSRALLAVADDMRDIWAELAATGFDAPGRIAREAILAFAEKAPMGSREQLLDYWRELAKERLSALDSPYDSLRGEYVASYVYRSALIARLRSQAHLLPSNPALRSPQIEPGFKAWVENLGPEKAQVVAASREAKRAIVAALGEPERPDFAALDRRACLLLLRERYARTLASEGFSLRAPSRGFTHFQRAGLGGKYVFNLLDDPDGGFGFGFSTVRPTFAITWPGTQITSARLFPIRLIEFRPDDLVPEFGYIYYFGQSWPSACVTVDAIAALTLILFRRIDTELRRLQQD